MSRGRGRWRGPISVLLVQPKGTGTSGLPENPEWVSKKVRSIAVATERPKVDPKVQRKERISHLCLANIVCTDGASPASTNGTDGKYEGGER